MKIAQDKVVTIHYTLKDATGEQLESSFQGEPMAYLHGHHNLIPGLEKALQEKEAGAKLEVSLPPEDAYGERDDRLVETVPKEMFGEGVEFEVGMQFHAESQDGHPYVVSVTAIEDAHVQVDGNHPFAGATLNFEVEVMDVRDATEEELSHGHVHGPGGHQH